MKQSKILLIMLCLVLGLVACDEYPPMPTPEISPTPKATVVPATPVGALNSITIDKLGISMLAPSNWKPPVQIPNDEHKYVLSPDGSTDTSANVGPFMLIIVGDNTYFHSILSLPTGLTSPVDQLNAIMTALNMSSPDMDYVNPYTDAKYPAASIHYFERDNESEITLLKVNDNRWIYVGTQAKELYYPYYKGTVFKPAIDSIASK